MEDKLKWDKSSLLETDAYVKVYVAALNKFLSIEEKQSVFMISKFFTDGAAEAGRNQLELAQYYFAVGEKYTSEVSDILVKEIITNVYDRSKSFYFYKNGEPEKAIELINSTIENNKSLEKKGFTFLLFDRVSQYHNFARVQFSLGNRKSALELLSVITCFLIKGSSDWLPGLNENFVSEYDDNLSRMKYSMVCLIIFETVGHLQRFHVKDRSNFILESNTYFSRIVDSLDLYLVHLPEDEIVKKWLMCVKSFYCGEYKKFISESSDFIERQPQFYNGLPKEYLVYYRDISESIARG